MIRSNYPLKNISTIGLGGICKEFICPTSIEELLKIKLTKKFLCVLILKTVCKRISQRKSNFFLFLKKNQK